MSKKLFNLFLLLSFVFLVTNTQIVNAKEAVKKESIFIVDQIANNSADFTPELQEQMLEVIKILNEKNWVNLKLVGHTSNTGTAAHNMELSKRRAEKAKEFFVSNNVDTDRVTTDWKGMNEPIADNNTAEGRAKNRRVEILLITLNEYPMEPHIVGVYEGENRSKEVVINVIKEENVEYTATINGENYILGTPFWKDGENKVVVTGKKNGLESSSEMNFSMKKIPVDLNAPNIPKINGIENGEVYTEGVVITIDEEQQGVEYVTLINGLPYELGTEYDKIGKSEVVVKATKLSNKLTSESKATFSIDKTLPKKPVILGVENGEVYTEGVVITVDEKQDDTEYVATINGLPYELGTEYDKIGKSEVVVKGTKLSNKLTNEAKVNFEIDKTLPKKPVILGVENGKTYAEGVVITVDEKQADTEYVATINGLPYELGTEYSELGKSELVVKGTRLSNGLSSETKRNFEIDTLPPKKPIVLGVENGEILAQPVYIDVKDRELGIEYDFYIDSEIYEEGSEYSENGIHQLYVEAIKLKNGLKSSETRTFEIDMLPPAVPVIVGVENGEKISKDPIINIENKEEGVEYTATINGKPYELGTIYKSKGANIIKVEALKTKNNLTSSSEKTFTKKSGKYLILKGGVNVYGKLKENVNHKRDSYDSGVLGTSINTSNKTSKTTKIMPIIGGELILPVSEKIGLGLGALYEPKVQPKKKSSSGNLIVGDDDYIKYYDNKNKELDLIPVYFTGRYNLNKDSDWKPYLGARLGYSFVGDYNYHNFEDSKGGLYYGLGTGLEYKNFQFELFYTVSKIEFEKKYNNAYGIIVDEVKDKLKVDFHRINLTIGYWLF